MKIDSVFKKNRSPSWRGSEISFFYTKTTGWNAPLIISAILQNVCMCKWKRRVLPRLFLFELYLSSINSINKNLLCKAKNYLWELLKIQFVIAGLTRNPLHSAFNKGDAETSSAW